jgi:hypothetical protein
MSPDETTASSSSVVKDETARQAVILAFGVASVLVYVWAQRWAADPDLARSGRMRATKQAERVWARLAGWAWRRAEAARRAYEKDGA